jgi:hypothetical protein
MQLQVTKRTQFKMYLMQPCIRRAPGTKVEVRVALANVSL